MLQQNLRTRQPGNGGEALEDDRRHLLGVERALNGQALPLEDVVEEAVGFDLAL